MRFENIMSVCCRQTQAMCCHPIPVTSRPHTTMVENDEDDDDLIVTCVTHLQRGGQNAEAMQPLVELRVGGPSEEGLPEL